MLGEDVEFHWRIWYTACVVENSKLLLVNEKGDGIMEKKLKIIIDNCPQNHKCPAVNVCPVGALSQKDFEAPQIDFDKCIRCGKCSNFCPKKALVLESTAL